MDQLKAEILSSERMIGLYIATRATSRLRTEKCDRKTLGKRHIYFRINRKSGVMITQDPGLKYLAGLRKSLLLNQSLIIMWRLNPKGPCSEALH